MGVYVEGEEVKWRGFSTRRTSEKKCLPGVTVCHRWRERERLSTDDMLKIAVTINWLLAIFKA